MLSFWAKTSGTWINVLTILSGTGVGLLLRDRLPAAMQQVITQAVGLMTMVIGIGMVQSLFELEAGPIDGVILALLALVLGGLLGEWWQIEKRLVAVGDALKRRFRGGGRFTEGFVAASLLFVIGPMAILGSLNNGLSGNHTILALKSTMDGLAAIALTGSYGVGVGFSVLPILLYQGGLSLLAGTLASSLADPASDPRVMAVTGIGGMIIMGLGLNLLEAAKVRIASYLPALALGPLLVGLARSL